MHQMPPYDDPPCWPKQGKHNYTNRWHVIIYIIMLKLTGVGEGAH